MANVFSFGQMILSSYKMASISFGLSKSFNPKKFDPCSFSTLQARQLFHHQCKETVWWLGFHPLAVSKTTHRHYHIEAPYHRAEMKDDQLSRFIELAVFDLGEMKPFADFLTNKENPTY